MHAHRGAAAVIYRYTQYGWQYHAILGHEIFETYSINYMLLHTT
jgi:hypothetical protein